MLLDAEITKSEYNEITTDLEIERQNIETKINRLSNADNGFNQTIGTIFALASKAHKLFRSLALDEKRRIIQILFPNLKMDAKKLVFELRKPFDMFVNVKDHTAWLPRSDSNQRPSG